MDEQNCIILYKFPGSETTILLSFSYTMIMIYRVVVVVLCLLIKRSHGDGSPDSEIPTSPTPKTNVVNGVFFQSWISKNTTNSSDSYFKSTSVYDSLVSNSDRNRNILLCMYACMYASMHLCACVCTYIIFPSRMSSGYIGVWQVHSCIIWLYSWNKSSDRGSSKSRRGVRISSSRLDLSHFRSAFQ